MITAVHPADFAAWLQSASAVAPPVVLDVREPHELQRAALHPQGFVLHCIPMGELAQRVSELDPEQPIACLCHHGVRSMQVAHFLIHHGFRHVANITGGIDAWATQLDPNLPRY